MDNTIFNIIAGSIGVVMGTLFGISGFADQGKSGDLSKNQRVKNLLWLLGGAFSVVFVNWKVFSVDDPTPTPRISMMEYYMISALTSVLVTISVFVIIIYFTVNSRSWAKTSHRGRSGEFVLEYISHGYGAYRSSLEKLDKEAAHSSNSALSLSAHGKAVSVVMTSTAVIRSRGDVEQREIVIDQVLTAMEDTVKMFAESSSDLKLSTNFMVKISRSELGSVKLLFADEEIQSYDYFLLLQRYRQDVKTEVCLPVQRDFESLRLLPGAPMSAAGRRACHINTRKLLFRSGVSAPVQKDIKTFFKDRPYASVLSVPLIWDRAVVGIANIESNKVDIVNKGPDMIEQIWGALAPYCLILGELVHRAEERNNG